MKYIIPIVSIFLACSLANAQELQHFNSAALGQAPTKRINLLLPASANAIKPIQILTDINEAGEICGAIVTYPGEITLEQSRTSINKLYKRYETKSFVNDPQMGSWRNENARFAIQLSEKVKYDQKIIQVIYLPFINNRITEPTAAPDAPKPARP